MKRAPGHRERDPVAAVEALLDSTNAAPLWVGYSGGLDSSVLLHAACAARAARGEPAPCAVHVHHGLQPDADAWSDHCAAEAQRLGAALRIQRVQVATTGSLEAAARDARYGVFRDLLEAPGSRLLLAHHRDDQVETVLLRLLQGRGLYGMPRVRRLGQGLIMRPLLGMARADLMAYAHEHQLTWVDDPSNVMPVADRNFLRHSVLPLLRARFPDLDTRVLAVELAVGAARGVKRGTDPESDPARDIPNVLVRAPDPDPDPDRVLLPAGCVSDPARQPASLALAMLAALTVDDASDRLADWILACGQALPARRALAEFISQLRAPEDRQPLLAQRGYQLHRHAGRVWLILPAVPLERSYGLGRGGRLCLPHGVLEIEPMEAARSEVAEVAVPSDLVLAEPPFSVTFRRGGERLQARGRTRLLKRELQTRAIAPWLRARWPLVHDALGLCAVPGMLVRDAEAHSALKRYRIRWQLT